VNTATHSRPVSQLGDARSGKLAGNLSAFGRTLRRAGVRVDASRIALAQQAVQWVGVARKRPGRRAGGRAGQPRAGPRGVPRAVRRLFRDPDLAKKLLAQMLPTAEGRAAPPRQRPRAREALARPRPRGRASRPGPTRRWTWTRR
jgi:uncharacterized protein with von Willebrand factor type A (vWA) domain